MGHLLANCPDLDPAKLDRTRLMMDRVRGCLVTGHPWPIPHLTLPDPDDRHALAAAIRSRSDAIVTFNLKDFPRSILAEHGVEARHPAEFLLDLVIAREADVRAAVRAVRHRLKNPPKSAEGHRLTLEAQGLARTVARLRESIDLP